MSFVAISLVFFGLFFVFYKMLFPRFCDIYCKNVLAEPCGDTDILPYKLINATFPSSQIFNSLALPIPGREGEEITLGTVAVNRSGIYIICQIRGDGIVENPPNQRWRHLVNGSSREFENPFRAQADARELIEYYAKNAGLGGVRCHSLVVYTSPRVRFTNTMSRQIIYANDLNRRFSVLDSLGRLSRSEVNDICRLLSNISQGAEV